MKFIGIDGCKKGWFLVILEDNRCKVDIIESIQKLTDYATDKNDIVVIDIPIGLMNGRNERKCDSEARKKLGPRRSSVFPVPTEQAVYCTSYEECCEKNEEITGKKISRQAFGIVPKIREVDAYIKHNKPNFTFIESHPEVAFWSLNNQAHLQHGKKTNDGINERLRILKSHEPRAGDIYNRARSTFAKKDLAEDDVIDAICMAVVARYKGRGFVNFFPSTDFTNHHSIEMKIHYFSGGLT